MAIIPNTLYDELKKLEGGFVDNPHDHGGATKWGVTQAVYEHYYPQHGSVANITDEQWRFIIGEFWKAAGCLRVTNPAVAAMLFDWYWGSGSAAIRRIQRHFGLPVDGVFGEQTAAALNTKDVSGIVQLLHDLRAQHFADIVEAQPSQKVFANGWASRLLQITNFAKSIEA